MDRNDVTSKGCWPESLTPMRREQPVFFEAVWRGDNYRALEIAERNAAQTALFNNPDWSGKFGSGQLKAAMRLLGQPEGNQRRPRLPVDDPDALGAIQAALATVGLLDRRATSVSN
jgi:hypothetical protein